jgi:hypothetical protein
MSSLRVRCTLCDWSHEEPIVEDIMPPGMLRSFSDPEGLRLILEKQRDERLQKAARDHMLQHPAGTS